MSGKRVVVAGSMNCDLVLRVPSLPQPGQTILAHGFETFVGGKGANQAIACARLGAAVTMLGRLGDDAFGSRVRSALMQAGVDVDHLIVDDELSTGMADIRVDDRGQNSICVAPLANGRFSADDVAAHDAAFAACGVLLLQLETPVEASIAAARAAKRQGATVLLNPAPAPETGLAPALTAACDVLVLNESEAATLCGGSERTHQGQLNHLLAYGFQQVVITLGADGALHQRGGQIQHVPSFAVDVVDTTGAGDAFCGALAAAFARDLPPSLAIRWACAAGALACTQLGAEPSLPTLAALEALLARAPAAAPQQP